MFLKQINYFPNRKTRFKEWLIEHGKGVYLAFTGILTTLFLALFVLFTQLPQLITPTLISFTNQGWLYAFNFFASPIVYIVGALILLSLFIPAFSVSTSIVNWVITLIIPPRILPKMNFENKIPEQFSTIIVIPAMIGSFKDIDSLVQQVEKHYLRNPETGFQFAILTDFFDNDEEKTKEDNKLLNYANKKIKSLNEKYAHIPLGVNKNKTNSESKIDRFYFLNRKRLWNQSERKWMGWERKRGKLHEFNRLLRGDENHSFIINNDNLKQNPLLLNHIKYVITLDDDSILPLGAAKRLVSTMAHPLNTPVFSKDKKVISGYTILQPRMEIHPKSTNQSFFTRLFAGDTGLDIYTLSVSDTYMDLIGEGIFVGKGIYDVDAFEKSINDFIPENTILSHDLLEGNMGRAGLVTDITMVEDYPPSYIATKTRKHRWIRGDWQLLPWLFKSKKKSHGFNCLDHWKIFDNLRRSLLPPTLVFVFIVGLIFVPSLALRWTLVLIISLGVPLFLSISQGVVQTVKRMKISPTLKTVKDKFLRLVLSLTSLLYDACVNLNAILTTLYRLLISKRNLLQWTTAAQAARLFKTAKKQNIAMLKMILSSIFALAFSVLICVFSYITIGHITPLLFFSMIILLLWIAFPLITHLINRPIVTHSQQLEEDEIKLIRQVARRTWGFFESFVGPNDNWLPPDHFQELPNPKIAHRTSPTNIGLFLTSAISAYDFGYLGHLVLTTRLSLTINSMKKMEPYRGHFFNWYDTTTLEALPPHYVSTVDSGNLAACLIVTSTSCKTIPSDPFFRWQFIRVYIDILDNLATTLSSIRSLKIKNKINQINKNIYQIKGKLNSTKEKPDQWYSAFIQGEKEFRDKIYPKVLNLINSNKKEFSEKVLSELQIINSQVKQHQQTVEYGMGGLMPWMSFFNEVPKLFETSEFNTQLNKVKENLLRNFSLKDFTSRTQQAVDDITCLLENYKASQQNKNKEENDNLTLIEEEWLINLRKAVLKSQKNAQNILNEYKDISLTAQRFVEEMYFGFLYNKKKRIFHIGFSRDTGDLDNNFYNLLASEARIASLIAIAKGEVPSSHWIYLGRAVTRVENITTLLSWSGTMFEYLLPSLFLRSYAGTLLSDSCKGAVQHQIAYAKSLNVPWGISESGYYRFDASNNYQYQAFGVPELGFKRGLAEDLVITPHASLMSVNIEPKAVTSNLQSLISQDMLGSYGMYEALDFTKSRLRIDQKASVVKEYMAHHQGMLFIALSNYLHDDIMIERMHSDPRIQSVELLLQEQVPPISAIEEIEKEEILDYSTSVEKELHIDKWSVDVLSSIPQFHLLSNGSFRSLVSNTGSGYISFKDKDITRWKSDSVLDNWGSWVYINELKNNEKEKDQLWSTTFKPCMKDSQNMEVFFHAHMVSFRQVVDKLASVMEVTVSPNDPVEIRRIHLQNYSENVKNLRIASYGEVSLSTHNADNQHPAFNKLFIESEYIDSLGLQIFSRRARSEDEKPLLMGHMLVEENAVSDIYHEGDRRAFIGRTNTNKNPKALHSKDFLSGSSGATLDPIFSLGVNISLSPHENTQLAFISFVGETREELITSAKKFNSWTVIERTFLQANISIQNHLKTEGLIPQC